MAPQVMIILVRKGAKSNSCSPFHYQDNPVSHPQETKLDGSITCTNVWVSYLVRCILFMSSHGPWLLFASRLYWSHELWLLKCEWLWSKIPVSGLKFQKFNQFYELFDRRLLRMNIEWYRVLLKKNFFEKSPPLELEFMFQFETV